MGQDTFSLLRLINGFVLFGLGWKQFFLIGGLFFFNQDEGKN
jgi:hypothetical protein